MTHALAISLTVFLTVLIIGTWNTWRHTQQWEHDHTPHDKDTWTHPEKAWTPTPIRTVGKHGNPTHHNTYHQRKPSPKH